VLKKLREISHVIDARENFLEVTEPELFFFEVKDQIKFLLAKNRAFLLVDLLNQLA
jgi:hypothetical protein